METVKLKLKVGPHEFEAEGPSEVVSAYLEAWKAEIAGRQIENIPDKPPAEAPAENQKNENTSDAFEWRFPKNQLSQLFAVDDKRDLIRLRVIPTGDNAEGQSVLLALYGVLRLREQDELPVTRLLAALDASGVRPDRIDRAAAAEIRGRLITKHGLGKGNKYRLTSTGITRAEEIASELVKQFI